MAAKRGDRVVLIDADTFGGAVAIRCGVFDEAPGIARACRLAGAGTLTAAELLSLAHSVRVSNRSMDVVTGLLSSSRWPEISRDRLEKVIACARDNFDTVILDVGFSLETDEEVSSDMLAPRRNGATLAALQSATDVVAVSAADSAS
jgi:Mrp family chromosome partitioning ATPase